MIGNRSGQVLAIAATMAALLCGALVSACGGGDDGGTTAQTTASPSGNGNDGQSGKGNGAQTAKNASADSFDPSGFGNPATGASEFLPLEPGRSGPGRGSSTSAAGAFRIASSPPSPTSPRR